MDSPSAGARVVKARCKTYQPLLQVHMSKLLAKRGVNFEDRLVLRYHTNKLRMAMTYSRDSAARPLAILAQVLQEIRDGVFDPDSTRSGRLKPGAKPLDSNWTAAASGSGSALEIQHAEVITIDESSLVDLTQPKSETQDVELETPCVELDGHVTTDSSSSSGEEFGTWAPVVGHYKVDIPVDKSLWLNTNTKMFHLSHAEYVRILLCGRRITSSFKSHSGPIRFDAGKCRQCFRLKDSPR